MFYYAETLQSDCAVLVYPGNGQSHNKYPIKGSESESSYQSKRQRSLEAMLNEGNCIYSLPKNDSSNFHLVIWRINLTGTLKDTRYSMAQLGQFLADLLSAEIDLDGI